MTTERGWRHVEERINGIRLHRVEMGEGPPVVLLHGFPEFWWGWRRQLPALAKAGFRAIAPDLRGYNFSGKPPGVVSYRVEALAADVAGLIHALGVERAHLVGHDWGGVVAWYVAMLHPERVERLAILNAPHPVAFRRALRRGPQALRSWYAAAFQLPTLPEAALRAGGYRPLDRVFRGAAAKSGVFGEAELARYREAAARPGALTAMIHYYRAAVRHPAPRPRPIPHDTLLVWGERDPALGVELTEGLEPWVPCLRVERIPEAGHWVQHEAADRVTELLAGFLRGG
jgi:pimeloyl-ACP methyl ester carboxylesterase